MTHQNLNVIYKSISINKLVDTSIQSYNIINSFRSLTIFEDITNPITFAELVFTDPARMFEHLPFTGSETVDITLKSTLSNLTFTLNFVVTNYEILITPPSKDVSIKLSLSQSHYFKFLQQFSTSYNKINYPSISHFIKKFATSNLNFSDVIFEDADTSNSPNSFAFPYMRFTDMLQWINLSFKSINNFYSFLFFNPLNMLALNKSMFCTLNYLFKQPVSSFLFEDTIEAQQHNASIFSSYKLLSPNFNGVRKGGLGQIQYYYDYTTKKVVKNELNYSEFYPKGHQTTQYGNYEKGYENSKEMISYGVLDNSIEDEMIVDMMNNYHGYNIECVGILERVLGTIVTVQFRDYLTQGIYNAQTTGNYIIKRITHVFGQGSYKQLVNVMRNGNNEKINEEMVRASEVNNKKYEMT